MLRYEGRCWRFRTVGVCVRNAYNPIGTSVGAEAHAAMKICALLSLLSCCAATQAELLPAVSSVAGTANDTNDDSTAKLFPPCSSALMSYNIMGVCFCLPYGLRPRHCSAQDAEWQKGPYITAFDGRLFRCGTLSAAYIPIA